MNTLIEHDIKSLENKTTRNIINASYLFTQFSTLAKTYTTTAREPPIYAIPLIFDILSVGFLLIE